MTRCLRTFTVMFALVWWVATIGVAVAGPGRPVAGLVAEAVAATVLAAAVNPGAVRRLAADIRAGLTTVYWATAAACTRPPVTEAEHLDRPDLTRHPRDPRTGLDPGDPGNHSLLGTCPVCGVADLDDPLAAGVGTWQGWPAHDTCTAWLEPDPPPADPVAVLSARTPPARRVRPAGGMVIALEGHIILLAPADPAAPRIDMVCELGGRITGRPRVVAFTGLPADPPFAPVQRAATPIAYIHIPAGATEITGGMIHAPWTASDVAAATPAQLQDAIQAGQLVHLGLAPRRKGQ